MPLDWQHGIEETEPHWNRINRAERLFVADLIRKTRADSNVLNIEIIGEMLRESAAGPGSIPPTLSPLQNRALLHLLDSIAAQVEEGAVAGLPAQGAVFVADYVRVLLRRLHMGREFNQGDEGVSLDALMTERAVAVVGGASGVGRAAAHDALANALAMCGVTPTVAREVVEPLAGRVVVALGGRAVPTTPVPTPRAPVMPAAAVDPCAEKPVEQDVPVASRPPLPSAPLIVEAAAEVSGAEASGAEVKVPSDPFATNPLMRAVAQSGDGYAGGAVNGGGVNGGGSAAGVSAQGVSAQGGSVDGGVVVINAPRPISQPQRPLSDGLMKPRRPTSQPHLTPLNFEVLEERGEAGAVTLAAFDKAVEVLMTRPEGYREFVRALTAGEVGGLELAAQHRELVGSAAMTAETITRQIREHLARMAGSPPEAVLPGVKDIVVRRRESMKAFVRHAIRTTQA